MYCAPDNEDVTCPGDHVWLRRRALVAGAWLVCLAAGLCGGQPAAAEDKPAADGPASTAPDREKQRTARLKDVCTRIENAALKRGLPPGFFARLLWQESRFNPNAVSPKGAQGIAQFMPGTAAMRGLEDPFDPTTAIPASAHYLSDLRAEFGNLGLAAAAYNAGENRVRKWRAGRGGLPLETRDFVNIITGFAADDWAADKKPEAKYALNAKLSFQDACRKLPGGKRRPRTRMAAANWQPWGVHLTADWSRSRALARYDKLKRKLPDLLGGRTPMVLRLVNYSMGRAARHEVRLGYAGRAEATKFCKQLKRAGGLCLVLKTPRR